MKKVNEFVQSLVKDADLPKEVKTNLQQCLDRNDMHSAKDCIFIYDSIVRQEGKNAFSVNQKTAILMAATRLTRILASA